MKTLTLKYDFRDLMLIDLVTMSDKYIANQGFRFFFELVLKYANDRNLEIMLINFLVECLNRIHYFDRQDFKEVFINLLTNLDLE